MESEERKSLDKMMKNFSPSHFLRVKSFQHFFLPFVKLADNFHSFHIPTCFVVLKISLNGLSDMFRVWGYEHRRQRRLRNVTNYCRKWDFMHTFVFKNSRQGRSLRNLIIYQWHTLNRVKNLLCKKWEKTFHNCNFYSHFRKNINIWDFSSHSSHLATLGIGKHWKL